MGRRRRPLRMSLQPTAVHRLKPKRTERTTPPRRTPSGSTAVQVLTPARRCGQAGSFPTAQPDHFETSLFLLVVLCQNWISSQSV